MFFGHLADHLILFPTTQPIDSGGASRNTIPFENGALEIWTAKSRRAQRQGRADLFVLRFYGNADRADRWPALEAGMWNDRAVEIWGMNYPGFSASTGPPRLARIGPAAIAAFDALKRHAASVSTVDSAPPSGSNPALGTNRSSAPPRQATQPKAPIVLFGTSIGATAALHVAASRPGEIAALILQNPPPLRELILRQFGWWNLWLLAGPVALQIPRELDSIANATVTRVPAIFLLAEKDEIVAPRFHRSVVQAYAGEKRVIELRGAHHNDPIEAAALANLNHALDWVLTTKCSAPAL